MGPILFIIFINDLPNEIRASIKIFADDTKIFKAIRSITDINHIQEDINRLVTWSLKWQLHFNKEKCKVVHYGKNNPHNNYKIGNSNLVSDTTEKDLGITFDNQLTFAKHINQICAKANSRVGIIKKNFATLNIQNVRLLHKSLVRPILEYGSVIWSPHLRKDIMELEKVQKRVTKLVPELQHLPYEQRLKQLNLTTLEYRRKRSDIIQIFRIIKGIDNLDIDDFLEMNTESNTRGHKYKLKKIRCLTTKKLQAFPHRVINIWNALPKKAIECDTINTFKTAIEKHWKQWGLKYNINST